MIEYEVRVQQWFHTGLTEKEGQALVARVHGHTLTLSGSYGADGLPDTVCDEVFEHGVEIPQALRDAWANGGGWNGSGSEASAMREWALADLKELRA
jgi:hypothetical protein